MRSRLAIAIYYCAIILLVACTGIIVLKLLFLPPCTPAGANTNICTVDGWSAAGLAATVLGVAATVLAILGAFAVAAWWTELDKRVKRQVTELFKEQTTLVNQQVDELVKEQLRKVDDQIAQSRTELLHLDEHMKDLQKTTQTSIKDLHGLAQLQKMVLQDLFIGDRLLARGRVDTALSVYEQVKAVQPIDAQVNYILGQIYNDIGAYDRAIPCLEIAVTHEAGFALAHYELAMAYRNQANKLYSDPKSREQRDKLYGEAVKQMEKAVQLLPHDETMLITLGGTYRRIKNYKNALKYYEEAIDLNPNSSYALGNYAFIAWHEGKLEAARSAFTRTEGAATRRITVDDSYEPQWDYYDRAIARLVLGRKAEAIEDYRKAVELTHSSLQFSSVLDGFQFLQEVQDRYPINGLEEAHELVLKAKNEWEAQQERRASGYLST